MTGEALAALGPDVSRQGPAVRHGVTDYMRSAVEVDTLELSAFAQASQVFAAPYASGPATVRRWAEEGGRRWHVDASSS